MKAGDVAASSGSKAVERLRAELLTELNLMTPADLQAYWKQVPWQMPDLVELAKKESSPGNPTPLAIALRRINPQLLASASDQLDPFGWLLDAAVDVSAWNDFCRENDAPWATRIWLAAASQMRAQRRLIHKAHGWAAKWEKLRRNPDTLADADEWFFAQLRHADQERRTELLAMIDERIAKARQEKDQAFLRRLRRAKRSTGKGAGLAPAEKFTVHYWLEMPRGLPGLCFFSDPALHALLEALRLSTGDDWATKQIRARLGLIQAGAKRHLIESVIDSSNKLVLLDKAERKLGVFTGRFLWEGKKAGRADADKTRHTFAGALGLSVHSRVNRYEKVHYIRTESSWKTTATQTADC
jgi:hypothetical protein